jgi:uncharacterized membrane protein
MEKSNLIPLNLKLWWPLWATFVLISLLVASQGAVDAQLPIHWGIDLEPDRWANKWIALLAMPAVALVLMALMKLAPIIEPRRRHLLDSGQAYSAIFWGTQFLFALLQTFTLGNALALGWSLPVFLSLGLGALLAVVGNYLGKIQSSFLFGIRTPWNLSNETVWRKSHRHSGFLFFVYGVLLFCSAPWASKTTLLMAAVAGTAMCIWVVVHSYLLWRNAQKTHGQLS